MPPGAGSSSRSRLSILFALLALALAARSARAQDVSVVRIPRSPDMGIRLLNLTTHETYDRGGGTYFIVPTGRYSVQLLRNGSVAYQEAEYISPESPHSRTVDPSGSAIVVGLSAGNPNFGGTLCAALETAAQQAVAIFGLPDSDVHGRLQRAAETGIEACANDASIDAVATTLAGSYGVTPLGLVALYIEYTPLASPRNHAHRGPQYRAAAPSWPGIVDDLRNGISDVAIDGDGRPLLACAAPDPVTPLFCDSDGNVMASTINARFRGVYRLHIKTTPVDYRGIEDDHWTTFVDAAELRETESRLAKDVEAIRVGLPQVVQQIEAKSFVATNASGQSVRNYPAADLSVLIQTVQAEMDQALQDETLHALRRHFPDPIAKLDTPGPSVPEADAHKLFRQLAAEVEVLSNAAGNLGVDLVFKTTPVETEGAELTFDACGRCHPIISQGGEHRFYRGRYRVRAALDGYVPYEGWLDITDDPKTVFQCELVRVRRAPNGRASTCSLTAQ